MIRSISDALRAPGAWAVLAAAGMLGWVALHNATEDRAAANAPFRALIDVRSEAERAELARLLQEAYTVLRSPRFQANLASLAQRYPVVYANGSDQAAPLGKIGDLVALKPWGSRYVPVDVALVGGAGGDDPDRYQAMAGEGPGEGRYSDMTLGRFVMADFASPDVVERSCAINVAAHEYAHTISASPIGYMMAFSDTTAQQTQIARRDRSTPVASYLIGAVAQCTWLQQQGRVAADGLQACVEVFGVASGNDQRCGQFADGQPVAERPDLAPASPPL